MATTLTIDAWLDGVDAEARAKRLTQNLLVEPFAVIQDASGAYYTDQAAIVRINGITPTRRGIGELYEFSLDCVYVGNELSHDLDVVATAAQVANEWGIPGVVALRIPQGCTPPGGTFADSTRRVVRDLATYATHETNYVAGRRTRNGVAPLICRIDAPANLPTGQVRAKDSVGGILEGIGVDLANGTVENVAVRASFTPATNNVILTDLIHGSAIQGVAFPETYSRAHHARVGLPAGLRRHILQLNSASKPTFTFLDNGVVLLRPNGGAVTLTSAPARTYGGGVYWHLLATNTYLVGSSDFSLAAGVASYGTPALGTEIVNNAGFESYATTPGPPALWTSLGGNATQLIREEVLQRSGLYGLKIAADASIATPGIKQTITGLINGSPHVVAAWAKTDGQAGSQARLKVRNVTDSVDALVVDGTAARTTYELLRGSFTPAVGKTYELHLLNPAAVASEVVYFDDASVKKNDGQGANSTNAGMVFGYVYTTETGAALDKRLRECFTDLLVEWMPEAK